MKVLVTGGRESPGIKQKKKYWYQWKRKYWYQVQEKVLVVEERCKIAERGKNVGDSTGGVREGIRRQKKATGVL